jgi:phosphoglycolate phosphatase-like HAD superfamily hydrolase
MRRSLYIFDLDGTLAEKWETTLLAGVADVVPRLEGEIAVATNQAGVGWYAVKGDPYPPPSQVGQRLVAVAQAVPRLEEALWLVSIGDERLSLPPERWRSMAAGVTGAAEPLRVRTSSDPSWRKPRPGMLLEACRTFDVPREEAVFIGDREDDAEAAEAADIDFVDADSFFDRE